MQVSSSAGAKNPQLARTLCSAPACAFRRDEPVAVLAVRFGRVHVQDVKEQHGEDVHHRHVAADGPLPGPGDHFDVVAAVFTRFGLEEVRAADIVGRLQFVAQLTPALDVLLVGLQHCVHAGVIGLAVIMHLFAESVNDVFTRPSARATVGTRRMARSGRSRVSRRVGDPRTADRASRHWRPALCAVRVLPAGVPGSRERCGLGGGAMSPRDQRVGFAARPCRRAL